VDPEPLRAFNRRAARRALPVEYSFLCGFPGEENDDLHASVQLAMDLLGDNPNARVFQFGVLFPMPGTRLEREWVDGGWRRQWSLDRYGDLEIGATTGPWVDPARARRLVRLNFASNFLSPKTGSLSDANVRIAEYFRRAYAPVARTRMRRLWLRAMPEERAARMLLGLL